MPVVRWGDYTTPPEGQHVHSNLHAGAYRLPGHVSARHLAGLARCLCLQCRHAGTHRYCDITGKLYMYKLDLKNLFLNYFVFSMARKYYKVQL